MTTANNVDGFLFSLQTPVSADLASFDADSTEWNAGGAAAVDYFQMRGWGTVSTTHVYWEVTGSPDFAGASAPEVVTDVVLFRKWTA